MNCLVCFEALTEGPETVSSRSSSPAIRCSNPRCRQVVCFLCINSLVTHSVQQDHLPVCLREGCSGVYLSRSLPSDAGLLQRYAQTVRRFYSKPRSQDGSLEERGLGATRPSSYQELIETIRHQRRVYPCDRFPPAIAFIAAIAMPADLANVKRAQVSETKAIVSARAYCSNYNCNGLRDANDKCNACDQAYCTKCDRRLVPGHEKLCGTQGSHNDQLVIECLSNRLSNAPDVLSLLTQLQEVRPAPPRDTSIMTLIKRQNVSTMSQEKRDRDLLQIFDSMVVQMTNYQQYVNLIDWLFMIANNKTIRPQEVKVVINAYLNA